MKIPEGWKEALLEEMERRFAVTKEKGRLHDDALSIDDTQIGIEFAIDFIESMLEADQTPPVHNPLSADERELHHMIRCAIALVARNDLSEVAGESRTVVAHKLELMLAAMPAQSDEPVAWMIEFTYGEKRRGLFERNLINEYREIDPNALATPLYTRPDGLRTAAEEVVGCFDDDVVMNVPRLIKCIHNLRTELNKGEA